MRFRLLLLFVVTPLVEMVLLIRLGQLMGFWPTMLLVLLTGVVGGTLARSQGLATWRRFQTSVSSGGVPTREIVDGVIILISAVLLLTPGVLTDIVGFFGLIPPARSALRRFVSRRISLRPVVHGPAGMGGTERRSAHREPDVASGWTGAPRQRPRYGSTRTAESDSGP